MTPLRIVDTYLAKLERQLREGASVEDMLLQVDLARKVIDRKEPPIQPKTGGRR